MRLRTSIPTLLATLAVFALASLGLLLFGPNAGAAPVPANPGVINFDTANQTVTESGSVDLMLTRTSGSDGVISAFITGVGGTATNNIDYAGFNGMGVTWLDGDTDPKTISIFTFADAVAELDETINIQLIANEPTTAANVAGPTNTTIVTIEDQPVGYGVINFDTIAGTQTVAEGDNIELILTRTGGSNGAIDAFIISVGGTATTNDDHPDFNGTSVTWTDGDADPKTIVIPTFTDLITEGDETVNIQLIANEQTTASNVAGATNQSSVTIEDDPLERGLINFEAPSQTVAEGDNVELILTRTGGSDGAIDAFVTSIGGTATSNDDYADFNGIGVTWADGDTDPKAIVIPTFTDAITEGDETLDIQLFANEQVTAANVAGPTNQTQITITETPVAPTPGPAPTTTPTPGPTPTTTPDPGPAPTTTPNLPVAPQPTPIPTPDPIVGPIVAASITANLDAGTVTVAVPGALSVWITGAETVTLKANGAVVYEGTLPAGGIITVPWNNETPLTSLTFATRLTTRAPYSETVAVSQADTTKGSVPAVTSASRQSHVVAASPAPLATATSNSVSSPPVALAGLVLVTIAAGFGTITATRRRGPIEF